jgi:hypothetical protein
MKQQFITVTVSVDQEFGPSRVGMALSMKAGEDLIAVVAIWRCV